jgi:teichuronic acid exporter
LNPPQHSQKMSNLKKRAYSGILWSAVELLSFQAVSFLIGLIVARILAPADYGLIGMIAIFIALGQSVVESGFNSALIQKKEASEEDYSTAFYFFIVVGIVMCLSLFVAADPIARFYNEPRLRLITQVMSLNFVFVSIGLIQRSMLMKDLDFKSLAKVSFISGLISGVVGLVIAYRGGGVWALAMEIIIKNVLDAALLCALRRWKPTTGFSFPHFKELYRFGYSIFLSGMINTFFRNIFCLIIGKQYTSSELGYYTRADQFQRAPSNMILNIIRRVSFPVFSQLQDDPAELRAGYRKTMRLTMFCVVPFMFMMILTARSFVIVALTEKWLPCVPYLELLSLTGIFYSIYSINISVVNAKGRGHLYMFLNTLDKALIILFIFLTVKKSVMIMIYGQIAAAGLSYFVVATSIKRILRLGIVEQAKNIAPAVLLSGVMLAVGSLAGRLVNEGIERLALTSVTGAVVYFLLCYLFGVDELFEAWRLLKEKILFRLPIGRGTKPTGPDA